MPKRVFIIDDEPGMIRIATELLEENSYEVQSTTSPKEGLRKLEANPPDLLLLDIKMPEMDGFEVCKQLKANSKTKNIPIVIVSVHADEADVVVGLELGADDYIIKPFRKREILARLKAVLRRKETETEQKVFQSGPLKVDVGTYKAVIDGKEITLRPKEFELLVFLLRHEGQVLTRMTISQKVWKVEHLPTSRTIDFHVDQLRKKLGQCGEWIKGLRGIGYRFEVEE